MVIKMALLDRPYMTCYWSILYHFQVIWCWTSWPQNLGYRSSKVTETGTIWQLGYFPIHPP